MPAGLDARPQQTRANDAATRLASCPDAVSYRRAEEVTLGGPMRNARPTWYQLVKRCQAARVAATAAGAQTWTGRAGSRRWQALTARKSTRLNSSHLVIS